MFNNLFPKVVQFMRHCEKIRQSQTDHGRQYKKMHALCMLDK
jgi:hypothetical protein